MFVNAVLFFIIITHVSSFSPRDSFYDSVFEKTKDRQEPAQVRPSDHVIRQSNSIPQVQPQPKPPAPPPGVLARQSVYAPNLAQTKKSTPEEVNQRMRHLVERRKFEIERIYHQKIDRPVDTNLTFGSPCVPVPEDSLTTDECVRNSIPNPRVVIYSVALQCDPKTKTCTCAWGLSSTLGTIPELPPKSWPQQRPRLPFLQNQNGRPQQQRQFLQNMNMRRPQPPNRQFMRSKRQQPQPYFEGMRQQQGPQPYIPNEKPQEFRFPKPQKQQIPGNVVQKPQQPNSQSVRFNGELCLAFPGELCRDNVDCGGNPCKEIPRPQIPPKNPDYIYNEEESSDEAERFCAYTTRQSPQSLKNLRGRGRKNVNPALTNSGLSISLSNISIPYFIIQISCITTFKNFISQ